MLNAHRRSCHIIWSDWIIMILMAIFTPAGVQLKCFLILQMVTQNVPELFIFVCLFASVCACSAAYIDTRMSFVFHSLFLHAFINWYQVLGLCSHRTSSVYSSNRLQGDVCIYPVCVPYWNVIYILSCLYFSFSCNPYNIVTWTTCIYI